MFTLTRATLRPSCSNGHTPAHDHNSQVLVLYTNELAENPLSAIRKTEAFLGAPEHKYDSNRLSMVFNSRACYVSHRCVLQEGGCKGAWADASHLPVASTLGADVCKP